jgi:hypothetical protein
MRFAAFIAVGVAGVAAIAAARPVSAPREAAREVLKARGCGSCHDSAVSTEHPNALAVYDLHETDWSAKMSDARLPKLMTRLRSAPAADREVVKRFITAELTARAPAK